MVLRRNGPPVWLRTRQLDDFPEWEPLASFEWEVKRVEHAPWIETLEAALPLPFPRSFRSLVLRYAYPSLAIGPLQLFANTGEDRHDEMSQVILRDKRFSQTLLQHGYLQFARPDTGCYDPICFNTRIKSHRHEYPIVRMDHESILWDGRIRYVREIALSFLDFVMGFGAT